MRLFSGRLSPLIALVVAAACSRNAKSVSLYEGGDYAAAARAADDGLADHPDDRGLWQMRVRAALALGDGDGVVKAYGSYRGKRGEDDKELLRDLAVATLGQALASPSAKLKIVAIDAVAANEIHALADQVAERMGDDDDRVAAAAAVAVLRGFPEAPKVAADMLRSQDAEARRIAVEGVGKKIGALAIADLEKAAADPDPRVRHAATRWLGELVDKDAVELLGQHLASDPDESVRAASATALARIGAGDLAGFAKKALADRAALGVRMGGVELALAAKQPDLLAAFVDDPDPLFAVEAALALKRDDAAAKALDRAAASADWHARAGAANLASRVLGKDGALAFAKKLAGDKQIEVRLAASRILVRSGDRSALAPFVAALEGSEALSAAADLTDFGDERGPAFLAKAVRDAQRPADERVRAASMHRTARRVTPGLVGALADPNSVVRVEAAAAIATLARR